MKAAYDELLEEGGIKQRHKILLRQGRQRFGPPAPETEAAIRAITDIDRLERMAVTLLQATDWKDVLATE